MSILKWRGQDPQIALRGLQGARESNDLPETATKPRPKAQKPVYRPATSLEYRAAVAICFPKVNYTPGSAHKRFSMDINRQIAKTAGITDKQAAYLWSLVWRYRRQIPSAGLVEHARRLTQPNTEGAFLQ